MNRYIILISMIIAASSAPAFSQTTEIETSSWFKKILNAIEANTIATENNTKAINELKTNRRSAIVRPTKVGVSCGFTGCTPNIDQTIKSLCKEIGYEKAVVGVLTPVPKVPPPRPPGLGPGVEDSVIDSVICFD